MLLYADELNFIIHISFLALSEQNNYNIFWRYEHMEFKIYPFNTLNGYFSADIMAIYKGKWVFCKHKLRTTWEHPSGWIEAGESPLEAAKRELFEETGSIKFDIQPVEKQGHASSVNRFFRIYGQDQEEGKGRNSVPPQPSGQLFEVHGSKFKLDPVGYLGQASVLSIAHGVFFLGVGKDPFNGLLAPLVQILVLWGVAGVVG